MRKSQDGRPSGRQEENRRALLSASSAFEHVHHPPSPRDCISIGRHGCFQDDVAHSQLVCHPSDWSECWCQADGSVPLASISTGGICQLTSRRSWLTAARMIQLRYTSQPRTTRENFKPVSLPADCRDRRSRGAWVSDRPSMSKLRTRGASLGEPCRRATHCVWGFHPWDLGNRNRGRSSSGSTTDRSHGQAQPACGPRRTGLAITESKGFNLATLILGREGVLSTALLIGLN